MNQDKDEYEVGIPLDDLTSREMPPEKGPSQLETDDLSEVAPEPENGGLPSLFDEDELAEVGLKASPFDENDELPIALENTDATDEANALLENEADPVTQSSEDIGLDTVEDVLNDDEMASQSLPSDGLPTSQDVDLGTVESIADESELAPDNTPSEDMPSAEDALESQEFASIDPQHHFEALQAQIAQLQDEFTGKLKYDEHKDEIIDKLHQELQEYKQDIVKKHILSIVLDVVKVADDIRKWITYFRSLDVSQRDPVKLFRYLEAIPSDLEDIFYWQGVKPFTNQEGTFDPARQRAMKKIDTDDVSKDKTIAKSLRPGYEWEDKVIRQEMVAVYVYTDKKASGDSGTIDE